MTSRWAISLAGDPRDLDRVRERLAASGPLRVAEVAGCAAEPRLPSHRIMAIEAAALTRAMDALRGKGRAGAARA
jgi:hypothetical protein